MNWTEDQLEALLTLKEGDKCGPNDAFEFVEDVEWGESRWQNYRLYIVVDPATCTCWGFVFGFGKSENQDPERWTTNEPIRVHGEKVISTVWEEV